MATIKIPGGTLTYWPEHAIDVAGNRWRFVMPPYCGLSILTANGSEMRREPGPKHPFWRAVELWCVQGKREQDGVCVWDDVPEPKPILEHLGGKNYRIVGYE